MMSKGEGYIGTFTVWSLSLQDYFVGKYLLDRLLLLVSLSVVFALSFVHIVFSSITISLIPSGWEWVIYSFSLGFLVFVVLFGVFKYISIPAVVSCNIYKDRVTFTDSFSGSVFHTYYLGNYKKAFLDGDVLVFVYKKRLSFGRLYSCDRVPGLLCRNGILEDLEKTVLPCVEYSKDGD